LGGVGVLSDEQQAAQERITLLERQCQEGEDKLLTQMVRLLTKDKEEIRPTLEELKIRRIVYTRLAWKELCARQEEKALEWLREALRMQEYIERLLGMRMDMLGLGPYDEAARQLGISREELVIWMGRDRLAAKAGYYIGVADGQARNKRGASRMDAKRLLENLCPAAIAEASGRKLEDVCLEESNGTLEEVAAFRQRAIRAKKRLDELASHRLSVRD
jgi:hypothetical protein